MSVDPIRYPLVEFDKIDAKKIEFLSPSEKYDLFVGDSKWSLTNYERNRTEIMTKKNIPFWWGLCHNVAPSSILYNNPGPVVLKNKDGVEIPFGSSDVKALLAMHLELAESDMKTYFLGSRCDLSFNERFVNWSKSNFNPEYKKLNSDCDDVNPGSFHLALTNLIGIKKLGFVMDVARG